MLLSLECVVPLATCFKLLKNYAATINCHSNLQVVTLTTKVMIEFCIYQTLEISLKLLFLRTLYSTLEKISLIIDVLSPNA